MPFSNVSIVDFEQVNVSWEALTTSRKEKQYAIAIANREAIFWKKSFRWVELSWFWSKSCFKPFFNSNWLMDITEGSLVQKNWENCNEMFTLLCGLSLHWFLDKLFVIITGSVGAVFCKNTSSASRKMHIEDWSKPVGGSAGKQLDLFNVNIKGIRITSLGIVQV